MQVLLGKFGISRKLVDLYFYLLKNPDISIVEMALKLKLSRTSLYAYLLELKNKGLVCRIKNARWKAVDPDLVISSFSMDLKLLAKSFARLKMNFLVDSYIKFKDTKYEVYKCLSRVVAHADKLIFIGNNLSVLNKIKNYNSEMECVVYDKEFKGSEFIDFFLKYFGFVDLILVNGSIYVLFEGGTQALHMRNKDLFWKFIGYLPILA